MHSGSGQQMVGPDVSRLFSLSYLWAERALENAKRRSTQERSSDASTLMLCKSTRCGWWIQHLSAIVALDPLLLMVSVKDDGGDTGPGTRFARVSPNNSVSLWSVAEIRCNRVPGGLPVLGSGPEQFTVELLGKMLEPVFVAERGDDHDPPHAGVGVRV